MVSTLDGLLADSDMDPAVLAVPGLRAALERALERVCEQTPERQTGHGADQGEHPSEQAESETAHPGTREDELLALVEELRLQAKQRADEDSKASEALLEKSELEAEVRRLRDCLRSKEEAEAEARRRHEAEVGRRASREAELEAEAVQLQGLLKSKEEAEAEAARLGSLKTELEVELCELRGRLDEAGQGEADASSRETELEAEVLQLRSRLEKETESPPAEAVSGAREAELEKQVEALERRLRAEAERAERAGRAAHQAEDEAARRSARQAELEAEIVELERALRRSTDRDAAELEELAAALGHRDERIEELQEALRESVRITQHEETRRKQIMETVAKLEQRLLSLQTARALRCPTCRPLLDRVRDLERQAAEWRRHLAELSHMKQEALEAAVSEKDAHLALLEVSGLRTAKQAEEADKLRADRRRLMDRLRQVNEESVKLSQEPCHRSVTQSGSVSDVLSRTSALSEDADGDHDDNRLSGSNGNVNGCSQISPDSTQSPDVSSTPSPV